MHSIGVTQWFLDTPMGPESLFRAKDLGFSSIHINAGLPTEVYYIGNTTVLENYHAYSQKYNIKIQAISCNAFEEYGILIDESKTIHPLLKTSIEDSLSAALKLKIPLVYFPSFGKSEIKFEQDIYNTSDILRFACKICDEFGAEMLQIGTESSLSAQHLELLFDCVRHPKLSLLLDTQNPSLRGHSIIEIINQHYPKLLNQIHIKDGFYPNMGNARIGKGDSKLVETFNCLSRFNYNGLYILENDYRENARTKVNEDLFNLTEILRKVIPEYEHS